MNRAARLIKCFVLVLLILIAGNLVLHPAFGDTAVPNGTVLIGPNKWKTFINVTNTEEGTPINDFHVTITGANITGSSFPRGWMELSNTTNSVTWQVDPNFPFRPNPGPIMKDKTKEFDIITDSPFFKVQWVTTHGNRIRSRETGSGEFNVP